MQMFAPALRRVAMDLFINSRCFVCVWPQVLGMPLSKVLELRFPLTSATADLVLQVIDYPQMPCPAIWKILLMPKCILLNHHVDSAESLCFLRLIGCPVRCPCTGLSGLSDAVQVGHTPVEGAP
jgi:hypothetical protein